MMKTSNFGFGKIFSFIHLRAIIAVALLLGMASFCRATKPFEVVVLGDTQYYTYNSPPNLLTTQNNWIKDNLSTENIAFVSQVGDITDDGNNLSYWANASDSMSLLDGPGPNGVVPYCVTFGNHDLLNSTNCRTYFGASRYQNYSWFGGVSSDGLSSYQTFTAGGKTYLNLNLDNAPTIATLNWAKNVLAAHPNMPAIVSTHDYLDYVNMGRSDAGDTIWNNLVYSSPQIFMVLCGHNWPVRHEIDTNSAGKKVLQVQVDYQIYPGDDPGSHGGDAWLQKIVFDPDAGQIRVQAYSPSLNANLTDHYNQFAVSATFTSTGVTINNEISATQRYWNGGSSANGNWSQAANWNGTALSTDELLTFRGTTRTSSYNDLSPGTSFAGIIFDTVPAAFTLSGNAITLTGDIVNSNYDPGHDAVINMPITINSPIQVNTGDVAVSVTLNGVVSGSGSLTKTTPGTLYLTQANTYTGGTTILGGAIAISNLNAIPGSLNIVSGALNFKFADGTTTTFSRDVSLPANGGSCFWVLNPSSPTTVRLTGKISGGTLGCQYDLVDSGTGGNHNNILILDNNTNDFQGIIYMNRGTLAFTSNAALGNARGIYLDTWSQNGQLRFDADNITLASTRLIKLAPTGDSSDVATINVQSFNGTIAGQITGVGQLLKKGSGSLTLTGGNNYTGGTVLSEGSLVAVGASALGTGNVTIGSNASLNFKIPNGSTVSMANNIVLPTVGTPEFAVLNPSTTTTVRLTGKITGGVANQTFRLADSGTASNNYNVLVLDNSSNSFQGNIEILRGTLAFTSNAALGNASNKILLSTDSASSSLRFDANNITLASTHQIVLNNSANPFPINVRTYTGTIAGPITGGNAGATFVKQGTGKLILAGANTYAGSTQIDAGILEIGTGGTLPGGNVIDNATLAFNSAAATTWNNAISGTGGLVKDNSGTLTLTASDTYSGATRILNGTLILNAGGQLPNSAVENNSTFKITGGTNHSVLSIVGTGTLYVKGPNTQLTTTSIVQDSLIIDSMAETIPVPEPGMFALLAMFGIAAFLMKAEIKAVIFRGGPLH